ncbi:MAG: HdeD family acid-resistance protein [Bacteroidetes bacterium]|jgi:uncharacterized membrane protein HdeD (DUF308 family)|nr:HdeD family acid-resistance protein [Bacteroidota bacterium]
MENRHLPRTIRYWYLILLLGIVMLITGLWVFATPLTAYISLAFMFAAIFFITGVLEIVFAISNRKVNDNWGWLLAGGIIDLLIGILLLTHPALTMLALPFYVGFGILFRAVLTIGGAVSLKKIDVNYWWIYLILGILGVIFSLLIIINPVIGGITIVFYTGMAFILIGIVNLILAFRLRKLKKWILDD